MATTELSLAEEIRNNTAAVHTLTALLERLAADVPVKSKTPSAANADPAPEAPAPAPVPEPDPVDAATLKAAATKLAAKSRDTLVAILGNFGAKRFSDVKPEDYADFYAQVREAL